MHAPRRSSDRGNQLRKVQTENVQRKAAILDICQLRDQLAKRQEKQAACRREAEQKELLDQVEAAFRSLSRMGQESMLKRWRRLVGREIPQIENARALWEQDQWDPDARAWQETRNTIDWETQQVAKAAQAVDDWHRAHPVKSFVIRAGLKKTPTDLRWLEQRYRKITAFWRSASDGLRSWSRLGLRNAGYQQEFERGRRGDPAGAEVFTGS